LDPYPLPRGQNGARLGNLRARDAAAAEFNLDSKRGRLLDHVPHGLALKVRHARSGQIPQRIASITG
jgi:hypothetical protein